MAARIEETFQHQLLHRGYHFLIRKPVSSDSAFLPYKPEHSSLSMPCRSSQPPLLSWPRVLMLRIPALNSQAEVCGLLASPSHLCPLGAAGTLTCCRWPLRKKPGRAPKAEEKPQRVISSGLWSSARYCGISSPKKKEMFTRGLCLVVPLRDTSEMCKVNQDNDADIPSE